MYTNLYPLESGSAILQILFMLGVAFLLGYLVAWFFYQKKFREFFKFQQVQEEKNLFFQKNINDWKLYYPVAEARWARNELEHKDLRSYTESVNEHNIRQDEQWEALKTTVSKAASARLNKTKQENAANVSPRPQVSARKPIRKAAAKKKAVARPSMQGATLAEFKPILSELSIKDIKVSAGHQDDLKQIKGVGPFIEQKVNALGIRTFEQVSQLSEEDVNKLTDAIEFFPGRIHRDGWVAQAKKLLKRS